MGWLPKKCVVVPVDFSDDSFTAIDTALLLAESPSGVNVVHVMEDIEPPDPDVTWYAMTRENRATHVEKAIRERLPEPKYAAVAVHVEFGDPGHEIVETAGRIGAELIVISSHGRTGLKRVLLGSVTERVVRLAHCPVLVLKE